MKSIRKLIEIVEESDIDGLEVSKYFGLKKIIITKGETNYDYTNPKTHRSIETKVEPQPRTELESQSNPGKNNVEYLKLKSLMVGTFYWNSTKSDEPLVKEGDEISQEQIVGYIEAMKLMNPIESEHNGIIKKILIENAKVVEYGTLLFEVEIGD